MKPAIRTGLTLLIVVLLAANLAVVVVRHGRSDRTRVSLAPAPSTTVSPTSTTATTATSTTVPPTTVAPATVVPTTVVPTPPTTEGLKAPAGSADTGATATSTAPPATTVPGTISVPVTDPGAVQAAPAPLTEHPHTGGHPLSLLALLLVGMGLAGIRFSRRTRSTRSE